MSRASVVTGAALKAAEKKWCDVSDRSDRRRRPCSRGHQRKNYIFARRWFSLILFNKTDTKMKVTPSCSPRRDDSENVSFDHGRSISKSDLKSGQVKARS